MSRLENHQSIPLFWIAAAQGAALGVPHLLEGNQRETVLRHYEYVQELLKEYHPTNSGGWNLLPSQKECRVESKRGRNDLIRKRIGSACRFAIACKVHTILALSLIPLRKGD